GPVPDAARARARPRFARQFGARSRRRVARGRPGPCPRRRPREGLGGRARLRGLSFMPHLVRVGGLTLGRGRPLFLIAGPCVIESGRHALTLAEHLVSAPRQLKIPFIFKASFDKAHRTSLRSYRGPGLGPGLKILARIKKEFKVPVLADVHDVTQVGRAAEVCDVIQIPAFLSRQTDLLVEAGSSGSAVNIKKGQFLSPTEMRNE